MGGKWLELLKEIAPSVTRVLVPSRQPCQLTSAEYYLRSLRTTASSLGLMRAPFVRDISELELAVVGHARAPLGGLVMIPEAYLTGHTLEVVSLALAPSTHGLCTTALCGTWRLALLWKCNTR